MSNPGLTPWQLTVDGFRAELWAEVASSAWVVLLLLPVNIGLLLVLRRAWRMHLSGAPLRESDAGLAVAALLLLAGCLLISSHHAMCGLEAWRCRVHWTEWDGSRPVDQTVTGPERLWSFNAIAEAMVLAEQRGAA